MERIPITKDGLERLKADLHRFESVDRPENIKAIEEARSHGDISENAEYHAAKERQAYIDARIKDLKDSIGRAEVIEVEPGPADRAFFGKTVLLYNVETDEENEYQLLGPYESDPEQGRISVTSPLGKALIGREVGEEIRVQAPGGVQNYEIVEIY
jgi:transcription elongation factor GreA